MVGGDRGGRGGDATRLGPFVLGPVVLGTGRLLPVGRNRADLGGGLLAFRGDADRATRPGRRSPEQTAPSRLAYDIGAHTALDEIQDFVNRHGIGT